MSRLEELIQEYCPDGVEFLKIGDIAKYEQPGKYLVKSTNYDDSFATPVLTAGQTFILGYTNETDGIYPASKENPVIIFDDFTGAFKWVDFPFKAKSSAMKMITADEDMTSLRYLYHLMGYLNFTSDEHKRLWIGVYSEIEVPLPALPVQRKIVQILDSFTEKTAQLKDELAAELAARKQQYDYYRDKLLTFDNNTPRYKIGEICDTITNFAAAGSFSDVAKHVPYLSEPSYAQLIRTVDIRSNYTNNSPIYISKHSYDYLWRVHLDQPSIVLPSVGNCGEVYYLEPNKLPYKKNALAKNALLVRSSKVDLQFLAYTFMAPEFQRQLSKITTSMGQSKFNKSDFEKIYVPVPQREKQKEIVCIINRFNNLCSSALNGLPAEIEARQKQYEYYRDKLLSFKRVNAA